MSVLWQDGFPQKELEFEVKGTLLITPFLLLLLLLPLLPERKTSLPKRREEDDDKKLKFRSPWFQQLVGECKSKSKTSSLNYEKFETHKYLLCLYPKQSNIFQCRSKTLDIKKFREYK